MKKILYNVIFLLNNTARICFQLTHYHNHAVMSSRLEPGYTNRIGVDYGCGVVDSGYGLINYANINSVYLSTLHYSELVDLINRFSLGIWTFNQLLMFLRRLEVLSKRESEINNTTEMVRSQYESLVLEELLDRRYAGEDKPITLQEIEKDIVRKKAELAREKARIEEEKALEDMLRNESEEDRSERLKREKEEEEEYIRELEERLRIDDQNEEDDYYDLVEYTKELAQQKALQDVIDQAKKDAILQKKALIRKARQDVMDKANAEKAEGRLEELDCIMSDAYRVYELNWEHPVIKKPWIDWVSWWVFW